MCFRGSILRSVGRKPYDYRIWVGYLFFICCFINGGEYSSYFSYLLYFIYVGTLIVIFCIVVRLAPNPVFRITPLLSLFLFQTGGRIVEDLLAEDLAVKYSGGIEVWGDSEVVETYR